MFSEVTDLIGKSQGFPCICMYFVKVCWIDGSVKIWPPELTTNGRWYFPRFALIHPHSLLRLCVAKNLCFVTRQLKRWFYSTVKFMIWYGKLHYSFAFIFAKEGLVIQSVHVRYLSRTWQAVGSGAFQIIQNVRSWARAVSTTGLDVQATSQLQERWSQATKQLPGLPALLLSWLHSFVT